MVTVAAGHEQLVLKRNAGYYAATLVIRTQVEGIKGLICGFCGRLIDFNLFLYVAVTSSSTVYNRYQKFRASGPVTTLQNRKLMD